MAADEALEGIADGSGARESSYGSLDRSPLLSLTHTSSGDSRARPSWQLRWREEPGINVADEDSVSTRAIRASHSNSNRESDSGTAGRCSRPPACRVVCSQRVPRGRGFFLILGEQPVYILRRQLY